MAGSPLTPAAKDDEPGLAPGILPEPAGPAPAQGRTLSFFDELERREDEAIQFTLDVATRVSPEIAATAHRAAARNGTDPSLELARGPELKAEDERNKRLELIRSTPSLRSLYQTKLWGPQLSVSDLETGSAISQLAKQAVTSVSRTHNETRLNRMRHEQLNGSRPDDDPEVAALERKLGDMPRIDDPTIFQSLWGGTLEWLTDAARSVAVAAPGVAAGGLVGGLVGGPAAGLRAAQIGGGALVALDEYEQISGEVYGELKKIKDPITGEGLNPQLMKLSARAVGVLRAGLETFAFGKAVSPVAQYARDKIAGSMIVGALRNEATRSAAMAWMRSSAVIAGAEITTEAAEQFLSILAQEANKAAMGNNRLDQRSVGAVLAESLEAGQQAGFAVAVPSLLLGLPAGRRARDNARAAQANQELAGRLAEEAARLEATKRSPDAAEALLGAVTAGTPVETVYVPVDRLAQVMAATGTTGPQLEASVPGITEAIKVAQRDGTDVAIPFGAYHAKLSPSGDFGAQLMEHTRFAPDQYTLSELQEFEPQLQAEQVVSAQVGGRIQALEQQRASIRETVERELTEGGMAPSQAKIEAVAVASHVMSRAARRNVDPSVILAQIPTLARSVLAGRAEIAAQAPVSRAVPLDPATMRPLQQAAPADPTSQVAQEAPGASPVVEDPGTPAEPGTPVLGQPTPVSQRVWGVPDPATGEIQETLYQSAVDPATGDSPSRISTRQPTAKKATEDPLRDNLVVGLESSMADPANFAKNVALLRGYLNMPEVPGETDAETAERFIEHVRSNLVWLHDQYDPAYRERTRLWYDGARAITDRWTERYNLPDTAIAGVLAALSPQKDWFQNVSLAERVLDIYTRMQNRPWTKEMQETADRIFPRVWEKDEFKKGKQTRVKGAPAYEADRNLIDGRGLSELRDDDQLAAMWVRVFDETYHSKSYAIVAPEGTFGENAKTQDGSAQKVAWGSSVEIAKAVAVIRDPSRANVSAAMGAKHKVRNFNNNIVAPRAPWGDVTIDTHAVAAGLLRPLAGKSIEVTHNFAGPGSAVTGSEGTYGIYAEAYRRAAADRGILAREMQSITWEAVRTLYTADFKNAKNVAAVDAIWQEFKDGRISLDEARQRSSDYAGGIGRPEWADTPAGPDGAATREARDTTYEERLSDEGVPGSGSISVRPASGRRARGRVAARNPAPPVAETLYQELRGSITFRAGERPLIEMFQAADLSTFQHEFGHYLLRALKEDAAVNPEAAADWQTVKDYLGVEGDTLTVEQEEKWARSWEAYLMEGKAPSSALYEVFTRFAAWMKLVYVELTRLNVEITPDVRRVMDRLIATDQEIEAQAAMVEWRPIDRTAFRGGEVQYAAYLDRVQRAQEAARERLKARMMRDITREFEREWKRMRGEEEELALAELQRLPIHNIRKMLIDGTDYDGVGTQSGHGFVLDFNDVNEKYGPEAAAALREQGVAVKTSTNREVVPADLYAEMIGFADGRQLVNALLDTPPIKEHAVAVASERLRKRYGDLMADHTERMEEADQAMHGEERGSLLEEEHHRFSEAAGVSAPTTRALARAAAEERIRNQLVGRINPRPFQAAERKAALAAENAAARQDWKAAAEYKRRQLYAHEEALAAIRAQEEAEKAVKYMRRVSDRPPGIRYDYMDQIDQLLARFSLKELSLRQRESNTTLAMYLTELAQRGELTTISPRLIDDALRAHWQEISLEDLRALRDAVRQLDHIGRHAQTIDREKAKADRAEVIRQLVERARLRKTGDKKDPRHHHSALHNMSMSGQNMSTALLRVEQLVDWLDGGPEGPWRQFVWERMARAQNDENDLMREYTARLEKILSTFEKGYLKEVVKVEATGAHLTRGQILVYALNTGNKSNYDKMLAGESKSPTGAYDEARLAATLAHLTDRDARAVQEIWDVIESLWPAISELHQRMNGTKPPKIEARPVTIAGVQLKGGYFPMMYDRRMSMREGQEAQDAYEKLTTDASHLRPNMYQSYTKERTEDYAEPIALDVSLIGQHIGKVIHDVTHWEAVKDVWSLVSDKDVHRAVAESQGEGIARALRQWVNRVANDRNVLQPTQHWEKAIAGIRQRIGMVAMGFRLTTIVTQFVGFSNSMEHVKPRYLAEALRQYGMNYKARHDEITEMSGEMRHRFTTLERDIRESLRRSIGETGLAADVRRFAFYGIGGADRIVSEVTWLGAYYQAKAEGKDDPRAISLADRAVRLSQGAGGAKDISAIQASKGPWSLFTMFYSYFNLYYNRLWNTKRLAGKMFSDGTYADDLPAVAGQVIAHTIVPAVLASLLTMKGPEDEEIEEKGWWKAYGQWAATKVALYPFASIPLIRDLAREVEFSIERGKWEIEGRSPWARPIAVVGKIGWDFAQAYVNDKDIDGRRTAKNALEGSGYVLGLPTGQLATTVDTAWQALEGEETVWHEFLFGKKPSR